MATKTLKFNGAIKLGQLASAPSDPAAGLIYYNSSAQEFQFYNGSGFVEVADFGQLGSTSSGLGASLIGIEDSAAYFTATNVEAALAELYVLANAGGATEFEDDVFRIVDDGDNTKKIAFQAAGVSAGQTRTITMPDANVDLGNLTNSNISASANIALSKLAALTANRALQSDGSGVISVSSVTNTELGYLSGVTSAIQTQLNAKAATTAVILRDGSQAWTANQSLGGNVITNSGAPSSGGDLTNKTYVDTQIGNYINGVKPKQSVRVAADVDIDIATELEAGDVVDGITLVAGNRVLLPAQADATENGIYVVPASGAASRSSDFDSLTPIDEINGSYVPVQEGTYAGATFVQYGTVTTLGTDDINFTYIPAIVSIVGGDMITVTGSTIKVDLATVSGLESSNPGNDAGQLRIKLEASNPSLRITGSNELAAKLDAAGAITSGAGGLIVGVDNSTIEISSNALRVKDLGISTGKLADNAVTDAKLRDSAALSVIGRSANSSGDPADISAGTDGFVLRRSGTSLGFGLLVNANFDPAAAIDGTKVSPDFGSQNLRTTGSIFQGAANGDVEEYWFDGATLTGSASGTALSNLTFNAQNYGGLVVVYQIKDTSNKRRRTGIMFASVNEDEGTVADTIDVNDMSGETGDVGVTWEIAINGNNAELRYTTTANNKLMSAKVFKMRKA